ncbi:uncharacterized protein LACBIDRAFT_328189 [Laccaria bicolor S238N-H82]|uniref:Predicted protein n=1 Tax=Laccaria bicolor (strain S238N-H82 / ATCC MYA-4686) TaxID=486041 RepID=B0DE10_LACBS|nr:uncharacterized protein LACBIDRAFT_328189 [Laccaria bicolor S238N-H82]EDR07181.1 predicted protein [Laccaria bicolor S238N-H82]|eukprot:XP_001882112.1 predicted protein [Laccaria bicolor S238N-H82]
MSTLPGRDQSSSAPSLDGKGESAVKGGRSTIRTGPTGYVYYRLYTKLGAFESIHPIYHNDRYVGRIPTKSFAPPHTVASIRRSLCKFEGLSEPDKALVFTPLSSPAPREDSARLSLSAPSGPGLFEQDPIALVVESEKRTKNITLSEELPERSDDIDIHYAYYRLYSLEGEGDEKAKTFFDESDISLGRINTLFIAPPHTAGSLRACIAKVEGLVTPGHALYNNMELFEAMNSDAAMSDADVISFQGDTYPGSDEGDPVALVNATTNTAADQKAKPTSDGPASKFTKRARMKVTSRYYPGYMVINSEGEKGFVHKDYMISTVCQLGSSSFDGCVHRLTLERKVPPTKPKIDHPSNKLKGQRYLLLLLLNQLQIPNPVNLLTSTFNTTAHTPMPTSTSTKSGRTRFLELLNPFRMFFKLEAFLFRRLLQFHDLLLPPSYLPLPLVNRLLPPFNLCLLNLNRLLPPFHRLLTIPNTPLHLPNPLLHPLNPLLSSRQPDYPNADAVRGGSRLNTVHKSGFLSSPASSFSFSPSFAFGFSSSPFGLSQAFPFVFVSIVLLNGFTPSTNLPPSPSPNNPNSTSPHSCTLNSLTQLQLPRFRSLYRYWVCRRVREEEEVRDAWDDWDGDEDEDGAVSYPPSVSVFVSVSGSGAAPAWCMLSDEGGTSLPSPDPDVSLRTPSPVGRSKYPTSPSTPTPGRGPGWWITDPELVSVVATPSLSLSSSTPGSTSAKRGVYEELLSVTCCWPGPPTPNGLDCSKWGSWDANRGPDADLQPTLIPTWCPTSPRNFPRVQNRQKSAFGIPSEPKSAQVHVFCSSRCFTGLVPLEEIGDPECVEANGEPGPVDRNGGAVGMNRDPPRARSRKREQIMYCPPQWKSALSLVG